MRQSYRLSFFIVSFAVSAIIGDRKMIPGGEKTFSGGKRGVISETSSCIGESRSFTGERVRNIKTRTVNNSLTVSVNHDSTTFHMKNIFNIAKSTIFA